MTSSARIENLWHFPNALPDSGDELIVGAYVVGIDVEYWASTHSSELDEVEPNSKSSILSAVPQYQPRQHEYTQVINPELRFIDLTYNTELIQPLQQVGDWLRKLESKKPPSDNEQFLLPAEVVALAALLQCAIKHELPKEVHDSNVSIPTELIAPQGWERLNREQQTTVVRGMSFLGLSPENYDVAQIRRFRTATNIVLRTLVVNFPLLNPGSSENKPPINQVPEAA